MQSDRFPHLRDSAYPGVRNVDVYDPPNAYDYAQWQPGQRVTLCSVPWRSDYRDVVEWSTDAERDFWFGSLDSRVVQPVSVSRRVENIVRLEIPYAEALAYNYLFTDYYPEPVPGSTEERRLFYFVSSVEYLAPSTTAFILEPDLWTTYRSGLELGEILLEEGHAPADALGVEEFLADPLGAVAGLGMPEPVTPSGARRVASSDDRPLMAGDKSLVFLSPLDPSAWLSGVLVAGSGASAYTPPTFVDTPDRYGYEYSVSGFDVATAGTWDSYSAPAAPLSSLSGNTPTQIHLYAIPTEELMDASVDILARYPGIVAASTAVAVVPSDLLIGDFLRRIDGVPVYHARPVGSSQLAPHPLAAADFAMPASVAGYAKAYTYPYAWYELVSGDGSSLEIRVEEVSGGELVLEQLLALSAPLLAWSIDVPNVGSGSSRRVTWTRLDGTTAPSSWHAGTWTETLLSLGIPTYSVRVSGDILESLRTTRELEIERDRLIEGYQSRARSANTSLANTQAGNAAMITNTANSNSTQTANVNLAIAASTANTTAGTTASSDINTYQRNLNDALVDEDVALQQAILVANSDYTSATNVSGAVGSIGSSIVSGLVGQAGGTNGIASAVSGALAGSAVLPGVGTVIGAIGGAIVGAAPAMINAASNTYSAAAYLTKESTVSAASQTNAQQHAYITNANSSAQTNRSNTLQTTVNTTNNTLLAAQNSNNVALSTNVTANSATVSNSNAAWNRDVSLMGAQISLDIEGRAVAARLADARRNLPVEAVPASGDPWSAEVARAGFSIKGRTADPASLEELGAKFAQYGYLYGRPWETGDRLADPAHAYSYVRASRVLTYRSSLPDYLVRRLCDILASGTRVWTDPDQVNRRSVYAR